MNDVTIARSIAWGRIGFGLLMLIAPNSVLARTATERPGPLVWMARAFGIRDLVLGAGAVAAVAGVGVIPLVQHLLGDLRRQPF